MKGEETLAIARLDGRFDLVPEVPSLAGRVARVVASISTAAAAILLMSAGVAAMDWVSSTGPFVSLANRLREVLGFPALLPRDQEVAQRLFPQLLWGLALAAAAAYLFSEYSYRRYLAIKTLPVEAAIIPSQRARITRFGIEVAREALAARRTEEAQFLSRLSRFVSAGASVVGLGLYQATGAFQGGPIPYLICGAVWIPAALRGPRRIWDRSELLMFGLNYEGLLASRDWVLYCYPRNLEDPEAWDLRTHTEVTDSLSSFVREAKSLGAPDSDLHLAFISHLGRDGVRGTGRREFVREALDSVTVDLLNGRWVHGQSEAADPALRPSKTKPQRRREDRSSSLLTRWVGGLFAICASVLQLALAVVQVFD